MGHHGRGEGEDARERRELMQRLAGIPSKESELESFIRNTLGPTNIFPRGKIYEDDEGEIRVAIAADPANNVVKIDFGTEVKWIGFSPEQAIEIADMLVAKARECRGIT